MRKPRIITAAIATMLIVTIGMAPLRADWDSPGRRPIDWKQMILLSSATIGGVFVAWRTFKPANRVVGPDAVDFGPVEIGRRRQLPVRLLNPGKFPVRLHLELPSDAFAVSGTTPTNLPAGAESNLDVTFTPSDAGPATAMLTIVVRDGPRMTIHLLGVGRRSEQVDTVRGTTLHTKGEVR